MRTQSQTKKTDCFDAAHLRGKFVPTERLANAIPVSSVPAERGYKQP